jgi:hypothetical protein
LDKDGVAMQQTKQNDWRFTSFHGIAGNLRCAEKLLGSWQLMLLGPQMHKQPEPPLSGVGEH